MTYCAIDFGTSNSAVALPDGASIRLAPVEGSATTLPTAVFFNTDEDEQAYGRAALEVVYRRLRRPPDALHEEHSRLAAG